MRGLSLHVLQKPSLLAREWYKLLEQTRAEKVLFTLQIFTGIARKREREREGRYDEKY